MMVKIGIYSTVAMGRNKKMLFSPSCQKIKRRIQPSNDYSPKIKGSYQLYWRSSDWWKIYFLATAENTTSTYDDGEILGSVIGRFRDYENRFFTKISPTNKFEGLTLFSKTKNQIQFLLCEDKDGYS
jgi:hypothetical protein